MTHLQLQHVLGSEPDADPLGFTDLEADGASGAALLLLLDSSIRSL
jgi:hypothetical protein